MGEAEDTSEKEFKRISDKLTKLANDIKRHVALAQAAKTISERDVHLETVLAIAEGLPDIVDGVGFIV
jgi:hypothetical protein